MSRQSDHILSTVSALRAPKGAKDSQQLFAGVLMVVFLALLLIALVLGVVVYRHVAGIQLQTSQERLGLQLVANYVRANDVDGAVTAGEGPEGPSLVLIERIEDASYETRIYLSDGTIVEEYAIPGRPYAPERANKIAESSIFAFSIEDGMVTIETDQGQALVALHTGQGGA